MNRKELIEKIRKLEGLTDDERSALLELANTQKRYGLVWEDKPEDVEEKLRDNLPVLTEVKERAIISDNPEAPNHILIEGDNLEALTALTYTHAGKIDVIYIDPPYNTGAKNWKYNNSFVDSEDAYRHSKWLSWIKKRLIIARKLLKDTGIIIVTIDDYEYAQLKLLMDELFLQDNYLATVVIKNNPSGRSTVRGFSINHEYALFYSKSEDSELGYLSHNEEQKSRYSESDEIGFFEWENFRKNGTDSDRKDRPKQFFPIILNKNDLSLRIPDLIWDDRIRAYSFVRDLQFNEIVLWPKTPKGNEKVWKYGIERTKQIVKELLVKKIKGNYEIYRKKYLNTRGSLPRTWWDKAEYSARDNGTRELTNIFGPSKVFDFPKAPEAVKDCLRAANLGANKLVLDFFAGSGTTMHAVMQLNAEDGGHRQCILVTNNENGICENVTYERNKRVINGYTKPNGQAVEGLHNNTLRYYRTELVSRDRTSANKQSLVHLATDLLCIKEDLHDEHQLMINGKKLRRQYARFFAKDDRNMIVIYDPAVIKYVVESIKEEEPPRPVKVYVFSDGRYAFDDDFAAVIDKVELCALPDAIYEAYSAVLPPRKDKNVVPADYDKEDAEVELAQANSSSYKSTENDNQL